MYTDFVLLSSGHLLQKVVSRETPNPAFVISSTRADRALVAGNSSAIDYSFPS